MFVTRFCDTNGFLAFLALKVALKVNYDFESEICGLCWYSCHLKLVGRRLRNHQDFVTKMGFGLFGLESGLEFQL